MRRTALLLKLLLVGMPFVGSAQVPAPAAALLDHTIARMGGDSALRGIRSLRLDMMTQWARTTFANRPFADLPSYERNVELRDYTTRAWRNTRQFLGGGPVDGRLVERERLDGLERPADAGHHAVAAPGGQPAGEQLENRTAKRRARAHGGLHHRELVVIGEHRGRRKHDAQSNHADAGRHACVRRGCAV